jgi:hypothetical protein
MKPKIEVGSAHITPADGNVFADLGFSSKKAKILKADADRIIAEQLALKEAVIQTPAFHSTTSPAFRGTSSESP